MKQGSEQQYAKTLHELKKNDLYDLGVMLTVCATGGLDMVNEEFIGRVCKLKGVCCLLCAIEQA